MIIETVKQSSTGKVFIYKDDILKALKKLSSVDSNAIQSTINVLIDDIKELN